MELRVQCHWCCRASAMLYHLLVARHRRNVTQSKVWWQLASRTFISIPWTPFRLDLFKLWPSPSSGRLTLSSKTFLLRGPTILEDQNLYLDVPFPLKQFSTFSGESKYTTSFRRHTWHILEDIYTFLFGATSQVITHIVIVKAQPELKLKTGLCPNNTSAQLGKYVPD